VLEVIDTAGAASTATVIVADGAGVVVVPLVVATPAVALTMAVLFDVKTAVAFPFVSLVATDGFTDPLSVLNVTGTPAIAVPLASLTVAVMVDRPPGDIVAGAAASPTEATPAAPTAIVIAPVVPVVTPPDTAVTLAIPD
jgi:hypothetical protein